MRVAAVRAQIYADAVMAYLEEPPPSWRWLRRIRRRAGIRRACRLHDHYNAEALRLAHVVSAWVAAHSITAGPSRGPVIPGTTDHRPGNPARAEGTTTP